MPPSHILKSHFNINILILPSHLRADLPSGLFPASLPNKTLYELPGPHFLSISFFFILSLYLVWSTDHKTTRYVVFSTSLSSCPSWTQIPSLAPYSRKPPAYVPHLE